MTDQERRNREAAWRPATQSVRGGTWRTNHGETSEALFLNSGFCYDSAETAEARFSGDAPGFVYSRYGNPTVAMFERRIALLEGAEAAFATASGMAAVFASLMAQLKAGDHVVAARALFGSCHVILTEILPRFGIETTLVDGTDLEQWAAALRPNTRTVFFETPANPTLGLIDIAAVAELAHGVGATVVIDNVFATPLLQRPLELGADITVYSGTKHIDGQGRCLGGVVLGTEDFITETLLPFVRHTGPALSPFNAWVLLKALETFELRVERHCRSAATLADRLADSNAITRVLYPHRADHPQAELAQAQMSAGGSIISFELAGGQEAAYRFMNALEIVDISNNLGDAKSLVTHPATTTHRAMPEEARLQMGITPGLVRLSVGLEDPGDLADDLDRALAALG